jgi:hypothetical protein
MESYIIDRNQTLFTDASQRKIMNRNKDIETLGLKQKWRPELQAGTSKVIVSS